MLQNMRLSREKTPKKTCNMGLEKLPTLEIHFYFMFIEFYNTAVEI